MRCVVISPTEKRKNENPPLTEIILDPSPYIIHISCVKFVLLGHLVYAPVVGKKDASRSWTSGKTGIEKIEEVLEK